MAILTFRQITMLIIATLLSINNMVTIFDLSFILFSIIYMLILSKLAFPSTNSSPNPPVFNQTQTRILGMYVSFAAIIGLVLPIAFIIQGIFVGENERVKSSAPHLLLLAGQVFMEGVSFTGKFSLPIRVFVPVFFNSKRIFTIVEWMRVEMDREDDGRGFYLAVANMVMWSFNLFCFLLPVFLPKAFSIYYRLSSTTNKVA